MLVCVRASDSEGSYHSFFTTKAGTPLERVFSAWTCAQSIPREQAVFCLGNRDIEGMETPSSCGLSLVQTDQKTADSSPTLFAITQKIDPEPK